MKKKTMKEFLDSFRIKYGAKDKKPAIWKLILDLKKDARKYNKRACESIAAEWGIEVIGDGVGETDLKTLTFSRSCDFHLIDANSIPLNCSGRG
jgi:hypothetical protein